MPVRTLTGPKPPKHPLQPRAPSVSTRNKNLSARGLKLVDKLERLGAAANLPGTFSISFQEVGKKRGLLSSLVGVKAVDKLEHGIEGGRKMKAILMVRVAGKGIKRNAAGQPTKRVPAYGVKSVTVSSLKDIEAFLRDGTKAAKAAWKDRQHRASGV